MIPRASWRRVPAGTTRWAGVLLVALVVWFTTVLVFQLAQPLWWDELFTVDRFIEVGPTKAVASNYHSNNHRLFTLVTATLVELVGSGDVIFRLPSMLAGAAAAWVLALWLWREVGDLAALTAMTVFCVSPVLLVWVPQARGYGFVLLAATLTLIASHALAESSDPVVGGRWLWVLAVTTALGIATLPHFLLLAGFTSLAVVAHRGRRAVGWRAVAVMTGAVAVGVAIYLPALPSFLNAIGARSRADGLTLPDAVVGPFRYLVHGRGWGGSLAHLVGGLDAAVTTAVAALFVLGVVGASRRAEHRSTVLIVVLPLFGIFALLAVRGLGINNRTLLFLLPHLAVGAGLGAMVAARAIGRVMSSTRIAAGLRTSLLLSVVVAMALGSTMVIRWSAVPIEDYRGAVRLALGDQDVDPVTDTRYRLGVRYYDDTGRFEYRSTDEVDRLLCDPDGPPVVYLHQAIGRTTPLPEGCLAARGAVRMRLPQRTRGWFEIVFSP